MSNAALKQPFPAGRWTSAQAAALFGVPVENIQSQHAANAKELRDCERTARNLGRKYRGLTAEQWAEHAAHAETQAKGGAQ